MTRYLANSLAITVLLVSVGCIQKETSHTLYLSPDGSLTWTALERDVRSDAPKQYDRIREEQEFLDRLGADAHPMTMALRELGAETVWTQLIRRERPYTVITDARLGRIDRFIERLLAEFQLQGTVTIARAGNATTLEVSIVVPPDDAEPPVESLAEPLIDPDATYKIGLTEGRFTTAVGFTIQTDGAIAVLDAKLFEGLEPGSVAKLSIAWAY